MKYIIATFLVACFATGCKQQNAAPHLAGDWMVPIDGYSGLMFTLAQNGSRVEGSGRSYSCVMPRDPKVYVEGTIQGSHITFTFRQEHNTNSFTYVLTDGALVSSTPDPTHWRRHRLIRPKDDPLYRNLIEVYAEEQAQRKVGEATSTSAAFQQPRTDDDPFGPFGPEESNKSEVTPSNEEKD